MYTYSKRLTAQLLLFSFLLESCYNPHIGMGKKSTPQAQEASGGNTYHEGKPYDKYREQPTSHIFTTADNHPVKFTYHSGQWQAAVKEYANDSSQHRQLPVVFKPGLTLEDLVNSNLPEQKQLLHIGPDKDNIDHTSYVYVGKTPSQAKPNKQLLSIPAARQAAPLSQVGLAQPKKAATNTQQAQEQPGRQAVLALPSPRQPTGRNGQLPPPPARATSKPLPATSSEALSQQFAQNKSTSAQQTPRKRTHSFKQQNKLQHSQQASQAKRQRAAAVSELPQPAQPSPAITPLLPLVTQPKSLADKAPQGIADQVFLAQGGQQVRFMHQDGQWQASVREPIGVFSRVMKLPVACQRHGDVEKALAALQAKPDKYVQRRIHVLPAAPPYLAMVYLGEQGLKGGMDGAGEAAGDGEQAGASGSGLSQSAPQDREASLRTLQARLAQGQDITSSQVVQALHAAQTLEEQQALQKVIQKGIEWFNEQPVGNLTPQDIQAYTCLAHIKADRASNRQLLASYFRNLCNKIDDEYQHGEELLIEALEYTLQNIDSEAYRKVLGTIPRPLMKLGHKLLDKLDAGSNAFTKENYPTDRSMLYALHQALVLIQQIAPGQLNPHQEEGPYSRFKTKIQAIAANTQYYPIVYHTLLLEQSLQRLARPRSRLQGGLRRVGHGLEGMIYLYQGARAVAELDFDLDAFKEGCANLKEAFTRQGIQAASWYDWHQAMHYASLLSLEDASKYGEFEQGLQEARSKIKQAPQEGREALRFGAVMQLRLLALEGPTEQVREASTKQLSELAQPEVWGGKPAVMEAMLDGLAQIAVHGQGAEQAQAQEALETLAKSPPVRRRDNWTDLRGAQRKKAAQEGIQAWLQEWQKGCPTIKDRLAQLRATPAPAAVSPPGGLLSELKSALMEGAPAAAQAVRQELEKYYQHKDFAQVKSLFEGGEFQACRFARVPTHADRASPEASRR